MIKKIILISSLATFSVPVIAEISSQQQEVYKLSYLEREAGVDDYETTMLISDRYIRIDEVGEDSGYIVYDNEKQVIYSVSHHDKSVLVITRYDFADRKPPVNAEVEFLEMADAPTVSGKNVFNYRVFVQHGEIEETCMEIQLVADLLPEVSALLKNYQGIVSGQQARMTDNIISETQSECFFIDQVYNSGDYYDKGLPIQEWHSNERAKILTSYSRENIDKSSFDIPQDYRQFSIDNSSKTSID